MVFACGGLDRKRLETSQYDILLWLFSSTDIDWLR